MHGLVSGILETIVLGLSGARPDSERETLDSNLVCESFVN